jgi:hypothetical protein
LPARFGDHAHDARTVGQLGRGRRAQCLPANPRRIFSIPPSISASSQRHGRSASAAALHLLPPGSISADPGRSRNNPFPRRNQTSDLGLPSRRPTGATSTSGSF